MRAEELGKEAAELWVLSSDSEFAGTLRFYFVFKFVCTALAFGLIYLWAINPMAAYILGPIAIFVFFYIIPRCYFSAKRAKELKAAKREQALKEAAAEEARAKANKAKLKKQVQAYARRSKKANK